MHRKRSLPWRQHQPEQGPQVTFGFWIIKILATTLGETGGDTVTMTWLKADVMVNAGYLVGSAIFLAVLVALVLVQISAKKFYPFLYWAVIVASTTAGTAMADFATRSLGVGYTGGSLILLACLMATLAACPHLRGLLASRAAVLPVVCRGAAGAPAAGPPGSVPARVAARPHRR